MTADAIVHARSGDWRKLESLLTRGLSARPGDPAADLLELAWLYRAAAADAARIRMAGGDEATVAYLDGLLARAHDTLYRAPPAPPKPVLRFFARDFPRAVRAHARIVAVASGAFWLPFLFGLVAALILPGFAHAVMGPSQAEMFRQMYSDAPDAGRSLGQGSVMTSFYIQHNVGIAFQVFAFGILAGLGSLAMLVYQGLVIGTVFGFLIGDDKAHAILTFTSGHSAWELTAIVLAGAAGLRMGWALVATGGLTRLGSLRAARSDVFTLILGAAGMLGVAALIEGVWSPSSAPSPVKWAFAVVQVGLVAWWLLRAGRDASDRRTP